MKDLVKIGNSFNIPLKTYIADFEEDLDIILKEEKPPVGSIVEVINTGIYKKYKLGNDLKWYEILLNNSEGSIQPGIIPDISINATVNNTVGTPSVSIEKTGTLENPVFNLSFENLKGEQGLKGDKGEQGIAGTNGADGKSATIIIGSVTTVSPDIPASVTNTGTEIDAVFDFEIPTGQKGDKPIKGVDYYTDSDKKEIIDEVIASLPVYGGEAEDV